MQPLVLDTNVVLDAFVFDDARTQALKQALAAGERPWIATAAMRDELACVLHYPNLVQRMTIAATDADAVLAQFDRHVKLHDVAPAAPVRCRDADDQKFIDLAVAHRALLLSKDNAVLKLKKRLLALDVTTASFL